MNIFLILSELILLVTENLDAIIYVYENYRIIINWIRLLTLYYVLLFKMIFFYQ
jgi:hypothetical protein